MSHEGYHEPVEELSDDVRDMHRAIESLMEELEAVDWYAQRVNACKNDDLREILQHNADEEKEHAAMVLEWIRRRDPKFDEHLRTYLFTNKNLLKIEEESESDDKPPVKSKARPAAVTLGKTKTANKPAAPKPATKK